MRPQTADRTEASQPPAARFVTSCRPPGFLAAIAIACAALTMPARAETVLTGTQATYSLASALATDTAIEVVNVPADGRDLALLADYIARRMDRLAPDFAAATAVVTLTNALPGDPLYRFAREANIRIVDIDAALPWSLSMPGVALTESPRSNVGWGSDADAPASAMAPYFWLSIPNAIRMADIIAHDLTLLFPAAAGTIAVNLGELKRDLLALRTDYQDRLIETDDDTVFALTGDFVYLTNDMGLYVDGYFLKQDIRWTEADLAAFTEHLTDHGIRVVIHKWQPSEAIQAAATAAGAKIVVLQSGDPGIVEDDALARDGLQRILAADLEAIYAALNP
jgi:ABC-type Zn uptake system ZnuABC Zn-binding protein ZnuA